MIIWVTIILMTVFWPVCTQISITKAHLNWAIDEFGISFAHTSVRGHSTKQAFSAAEVAREEYFFCGPSPGMFLFIPCLSQMTSEISHGSLLTARYRTRLFKWRSRGVFQWCISQIMQQYRRINALTSKLWFGGGGGGVELCDLLTTSADKPHIF